MIFLKKITFTTGSKNQLLSMDSAISFPRCSCWHSNPSYNHIQQSQDYQRQVGNWGVVLHNNDENWGVVLHNDDVVWQVQTVQDKSVPWIFCLTDY